MIHEMRVKLLRDEDGTTVRLVYPLTRDEYGEAFETLGALAGPAEGRRSGCGP